MIYIVTFYSHFGAVRYKTICESKKIPCRMMPVPRDLSSSCGTCIRCEGEPFLPDDDTREEVEQIAEVTKKGYQVIYKAKNS